MVFLGERSIGKDRISEILALVNRMEKTTPPDFSIRVFGYVYVLGSQTNSVRTSLPSRPLLLSRRRDRGRMEPDGDLPGDPVVADPLDNGLYRLDLPGERAR
jgi:hypothetical protein